MVRELAGLGAAILAVTMAVWLGIVLGVAGMWWALGLLGAALLFGGAAVLAMRYDPERRAVRRAAEAERAGPAEGRTFDGRRSMPRLPGRDAR